MAFSSGSFWRHHMLSSKGALPLDDSVFSVAVTLLAFSLPDGLEHTEWGGLLSSIIAFEFIGIAILLYWFKLRRLIEFARVLTLRHLGLIFFSFLAVVLLPKMTELVLIYGGGTGSLSNWTLSQTVNFNFLASLFLVDGLTLLFALSLRRHWFVLKTSLKEIGISVRAQMTGFLLFCGLAAMQLFLPWFNNEFVYAVPIVLLLEEFLVARQFSRGRRLTSSDLPSTTKA